jgi:pimeloyl-ACP methyl ester carboxylesterase
MLGKPSLEIPNLPPVAGTRHRFVMVRDMRLHVVEAGPEGAPAVLLLHGFPQHWYAWRQVLTALAGERHVIAVDLPGFGWSDPSAVGYSTTERARTVVALLDELALDSVDVVGHDWGAWLAFRVALDAPQRVRRLVAISEIHPWPLQRKLIPNLWRMWVTALFETPGVGSLVQGNRRVLRWFLRRDAPNPAIWSEELVDVYADRAAIAVVARAGQRMHAAFVVEDIARLVLGRDRRRVFDTPTLLVAGTRDTYIPAELMAAPPARKEMLTVQVIEGGHFILDENPDGVIAAIRSHLSEEVPLGLGTRWVASSSAVASNVPR